MAKIDVLLGLQWGDEGKGKIVDVLTPKYDIIARFQGGPNAGHTLEFNNIKHVLHIIPSGIFHQEAINLIGNGVIIDPYIFTKEINGLKEKDVDPTKNLFISKRAHVILPSHRLLDATYENAKGKNKIGSTLKGIGPTYTDKTARIGMRIGDLIGGNFQEKYEKLKAQHMSIIESYDFDYKEQKFDGLSFEEYEQKWMEGIETIKAFQCIDSESYLDKALKEGKKILAEGAQGSLLDVEFGSYPFVTSSNTIAAAVCTGLGVAPSKIGKVFGVFKAYCTRVGAGPFPTELHCETGQLLRDNGHEYGSTTGRPRRCGWLDITALNYTIMLNGVTHLFMMKTDVLTGVDTIKYGTAYKLEDEVIDHVPFELDDERLQPVYEEIDGWNDDLTSIQKAEDLPQKINDYVAKIEELTQTPISIVSVGPDRTQTLITKEF